MSAEADYLHAERESLLRTHVQVHGYGFMLRDERLVDIARAVTGACHDFLLRLV
jgi:hypothetical protein